MKITRSITVLALVLALPAARFAGAIESSAYERDFGYKPLEIYDFAQGTTRLRISDINSDGRDDVLFVNNYESRLEILLRKDGQRADPEELPLVEETFDNIGFVIDDAVSDCRVADIDGDQKYDIVTLGHTFGIEIRWQNGRTVFEDPKRVMIREPSAAFSLKIANLSGEHGNDIIVSRRDGAEILWNDGKRGFTERTQIAFAEARCRHLATEDVNGDQRPDLLFFFPGSDLPLRVRLNQGKRRFGPEHPLPMPSGRHYATLPDIGESASIGCVLQNGKVFRLYQIEQDTPSSGLESGTEAIPLRVPLEGTDPKAPTAWAVHDIDQDGYEDFCAASPTLSQIHVYRGTPTGLEAAPIAVDSLTGISSIAFSTSGDLAVLSPTERILAIHRSNTLTNAFPEIVALGHPPLAIGYSQDGRSLFCVTRKNRDYELLTLDAETAKVIQSRQIDLRNDPNNILTLSLSTETNGLIFFRSYQPPAMYLVSSNAIEEVPVANFRALTENLTPAAFSIVPGAQPPRIVVANKQIGRMYEWRKGRFEITTQFNPRTPRAEIGGVAIRNAEHPEAMFFEKKEGRILSYNESGTLTLSAKLRGNITGFNAITALSRPNTPPTVVLVGQKELHLFPNAVNRLSLTPLAEYATDSEEPSLRYFRRITTGPNAEPMISLVDGANRSLEILTLHDEQLKRALTFEVYSVTAFSEGNSGAGPSEPHAMVSGDLNGDGISDLVCLVHDKLIIYPGE